MRTVKWLREELVKYPDDAVCFAYEGEVTGIVIEHASRRLCGQGLIYCSEGDDYGKESDLLPNAELIRAARRTLNNTAMYYDRENDKLVSMDIDMEIYPINPEGQTFKGAKIIDIEIGDNHIRIPIGKVDELIEGLDMAKKLAL